MRIAEGGCYGSGSGGGLGRSRRPAGMEKVVVISLLVLALLMVDTKRISAHAEPLYWLRPPANYTLFTGPLEVGYHLPSNVSWPHAFVRLEYRGKSPESSQLITSLALSRGKTSGTLSVSCGVLEFAGHYTLRMFTRVKGRVLATAKVKVVWPDMVLSLPDTHKAQTVNVELRVLSQASCTPLLHQFPLHLKILFQRRGGSERETLQSLPDGRVIFKEDFTALTTSFSTMTLMCQLFDVAGFYQAVIQSEAPESPPVATSNVMSVEWSGQYFLNLKSPTVFPCEDAVTVTYSHPSCSLVDRIRVFSLHSAALGSVASPLRSTYITEKEAAPDQTEMTFECGMFNKSRKASGFLFVYVSVSGENVYHEQRRLTVSAWPDSDLPIDGVWGPWSAWSNCSVLCGVGRRSRVRMCDQPAPKDGGLFCKGHPFEWKPCSSTCPDVIPSSPLQAPDIDRKCPCGCTKTDPTGEIIATGRCYGQAVWTVRTREDWVVALTFGYFALNISRQEVRVRDGESPSATLLFSSKDSGYPVKVISSGPALRVELTTSYLTPPPNDVRHGEATLPIHTQGFVAHYDSMVPEDDQTAAPVLFPYQEKTVMGSTITMVGIGLCVIIIIATVIFVFVQRTILQKRVKYTSAPVGESPARGGMAMAHSDNNHKPQQQHPHIMTSSQISQQSQQSSTSNASSPDGGAIYVDMEKPLTGKGHKADGKGKHDSKRPGKQRTTSTSSKIKLFKPSGSSGGANPKTDSKDYTTVKKGVKKGSSVGTHKSNSGTNTSQPLTPCVQFSQNATKAPPSKFDLLTKKGRSRKNSNIESSNKDAQASSDGSGSSKAKSVSTTKAEVNWPQSSFVKTAWNEMGKNFYDRHRPTHRPPSEEIPLIDTSSQESPSHVNSMVKSDSTDSAASSHLPGRSSKVRRPTSLTESYSSVQSKCDELTICESADEDAPEFECGTLKKDETLKPSLFHTPSSVTPTLHPRPIPLSSTITRLPTPSPSSKTPCATITPSKNSSCLTPSNSQKYASLTQSPVVIPPPPPRPGPLTPSQRRIVTPTASSSPVSPSPATIQPTTLSPVHIVIPSNSDNKPATSSPHPNPNSRSPRPAKPGDTDPSRLCQNAEVDSPSVLSKCSSRGSKTNVSSPTLSLATPSEAEGLELEYDDFIEDDPLSYFDYEMTQKLAFRGSERIGRSPLVEDEEDESSQH